MPSLWTRRYVIVARADVAAAANAAANNAAWDADGQGDKTFTNPLSASGNLPAQAYWCSTALTTAMALGVRNRLLNAGATTAEVTPIVAGQTPASTRFAVFDAVDWPDPAAILTTINLKRIEANT